MTIKEWKKQQIKNCVQYKEEQNSPFDDRLTFIGDDEALREFDCETYRVWYNGNSSELLNHYSVANLKGFNQNPIYERNHRHYFWSQSAGETFKRVHSGLPKVMIKTLTNIVGYPQIKVEDGGLWEKIEEANNFRSKVVEEGRALTLVEGYGAYKIDIDTNLSEYPIITYYEAKNVDYIIDKGVFIGIIFQSYYTVEGQEYTLFETRYKAHGNSYIEYDLFRLNRSENIEKVSLEVIGMKDEESKLVFEGVNEILAVPSRYFYSSIYKDYGESVFAGKLDLFDTLDEIWSQAAQTNRVSSPIVWYNPDILTRGEDGQIGIPSMWNRQLMKNEGIPDGEGHVNTDIITDQPDLNFEKYGLLASDMLGLSLTGVLSPATMGIDVAKKDNADAQREKEKVSILTRNNIIAPETIMFRKIINVSEKLYEWSCFGTIEKRELEINIQYNEFANPSLEEKLANLSNAWSNGALSTERYVELLWGDSLSDEEKATEVKWLDEHKQQETDFMNSLNSGEEDENGIREDVSSPSEVEEETTGLN